MTERDMIAVKTAERLLSGRAWDDFCDTLKAAGRLIEQWGDEPTELDRAEYYRFLTRLIRNGAERLIENGEPARPRLRDMVWRQSINVQCPDHDHLMCNFDEARDYRITGTRGTLPYFVIAVLSSPEPADAGARDWAPEGVAGLAAFDPTNLKTTDFLGSQDLKIEPDGSFELILSQHKPAGGANWLKLQPDSTCILIRLVWHERGKETAPVMQIERMDGAAPKPVHPVDIALGLARAGQNVLGYAELVRNWWQGNFRTRPNELRFSRKQYLSNGGVPDRHFAFGMWQKDLDEALVLEFTPPDCEYWNFQLCSKWQENLDTYEDGNGYVTKFKVNPDPDGRVRIVIAEEDPGIPGDWIDSFGHVSGLMGLRLIKTAEIPPVTLYRLTLDRLRRDGLTALDPGLARLTGELVD